MASNDIIEPEINEENELSDYQKLRISNIKRNNAKLRELGLISALEENRSNALAEGRTFVDNDDSNKVEETEGGLKKKRKRQLVPTEGSRKSLRLQGIGVDTDDNTKQTIILKTEDEILKERVERVKECREVRLRAARAIAEAGAKKAAQENPTATYEHCLMRVKTMTDKRLVTRVSYDSFSASFLHIIRVNTVLTLCFIYQILG